MERCPPAVDPSADTCDGASDGHQQDSNQNRIFDQRSAILVLGQTLNSKVFNTHLH
jgi:hypothetical protein